MIDLVIRFSFIVPVDEEPFDVEEIIHKSMIVI